MNIKSEMLIESKSLRETVIDRVDVLEKVKSLSMLPGDMYVTVDMTANYYEVDSSVTIRSLIIRNRKELESDGMITLTGSELKEFKTKMQDESFSKQSKHLTLLPRRAVLRIGMLLQESEVAKAIRSYLLDKEEEKATSQQPDMTGLSPQLQFMIITEQRQNALEAKQNELSTGLEAMKGTVQAIQETIVARDENWRKSMNNMFNSAAYRLNAKHQDLRNKSYELLEERAHCNLKTRLTNWHERLKKQGWSKSKIDNVTRIDVIENDKKLKEIYTAIIKELSISSLKIIGS